jgi:hypothetical protein
MRDGRCYRHLSPNALFPPPNSPTHERESTGPLLSAGLFDNALASLGEDGSAALSEDARRRRPVGMVTSDRRRGDARLFSCV